MKKIKILPNAEAPKVKLLGKSELNLPETPNIGILDSFPSPETKRDYIVRLECSDFTSLCPVTGQPDFASIIIEYAPKLKCVETKSLKFYFASYRNTKAFNEAVINRIMNDFIQFCAPKWVRIEGRFAQRGGISLSVVSEQGKRPLS